MSSVQNNEFDTFDMIPGKAEADKAGITMDEREFHCKGEFKGIHKGRPNAEDITAAADFAKSIAGR